MRRLNEEEARRVKSGQKISTERAVMIEKENADEALQELMRYSIYIPSDTIIRSDSTSTFYTAKDYYVPDATSGRYYQTITCLLDNQKAYCFTINGRMHVSIYTDRVHSLLTAAGFNDRQFLSSVGIPMPQDVVSLLQEIKSASAKTTADHLANRVYARSMKNGLGDLSETTLAALVAIEGDIYDSQQNLIHEAIDVHSTLDLDTILNFAGTYNYKNGVIFLIDSYGRAYLGKSDEVLDEVIKCSYSRTFYSVPFAEYTDEDCTRELENGYFKDSLRKLIRDIHASK